MAKNRRRQVKRGNAVPRGNEEESNNSSGRKKGEVKDQQQEKQKSVQRPRGKPEIRTKSLSDYIGVGLGSEHPRTMPSSTPALPIVRGLRNLGNTCFFNAVLQCLAQTPFLVELLDEMKEPGMKFCLLGGKELVPNKEDEVLPPLEGELRKWGVLTESLASTLVELKSDKITVVNPCSLLDKLTQRCPQFGGGYQHDSHELLHHLLEAVRYEDLERYSTAIRRKHGFRGNATNIRDEQVRAKINAYDRQAAERLLYPEQVFGGVLMVRRECQDCLHSYQRSEPIFELSLPVTVHKMSDTLIKEMGQLSLCQEDRQSPSQLETCSARSLEDVKEQETAVVVRDDTVCNGDSVSIDLKKQEKSNTSADNDRSATLAPRYNCTDGECSVQTCLSQFTVLETMTGDNKVNCQNCSERLNRGKEGEMVATNSTIQYLVSSPPAVLVLHLNRFEMHQYRLHKISRYVNFPMVLDIAPICHVKCKALPILRHNQTKILYSLYGVVQHEGSIYSGHYTAYVKVRACVTPDDIRWSFLPNSKLQTSLKQNYPSMDCQNKLWEDCCNSDFRDKAVPGKWYHVSDTEVSSVSEGKVLRSQAYLLFYERIW